MIRIVTEEDARQREHLTARVGGCGSGYVRYSAAMYFYMRGMIGDEALEVYRVCCKIDQEDPRPTLQKLGLAAEAGFLQAKDQKNGATTS